MKRLGIGSQELKEFSKKLLSRFKYVMLVNGNLKKEDAERISSLTEVVINAQPIPEEELPKRYSRLLPESLLFFNMRTSEIYLLIRLLLQVVITFWNCRYQIRTN